MAKAIGTLAVGATVEVPVNAPFRPFLGDKVVFKIADKNHAGYPANSVTLITDRCIAALAFDAKEPSNSDSDRAGGGNNRYLHSNLRQWLNSSAEAGEWYTAQHGADQSPSSTTYALYNPYSDKAGFLAMLDVNFTAALLNTAVITVRNTVTDGGGSETVTSSKVFLASTTEAGLPNENGIAEGTRLALFTAANASRLAYPTPECASNSNYTGSDLNASLPWYWWLRTPFATNSSSARMVGTTGGNGNGGAWSGHTAARPLCNLPSAILVSDNVNASGNYEFLLPSITGQDSDLGTKSEGVTHNYVVTHPSGSAVTVVEAVNGKQLRAYTATLGQPNALTLTGNNFAALANAQHTITITATDAAGNVAVRTLTFTKHITGFVIKPSAPLVAAAQPRRAKVAVTRQIPAGASFAVEVTNNPFDPLPVWEDCTTAVTKDRAHVFENTVNAAAQFGMSVRVTVERGVAPSVCWVSSIEGNFE